MEALPSEADLLRQVLTETTPMDPIDAHRYEELSMQIQRTQRELEHANQQVQQALKECHELQRVGREKYAQWKEKVPATESRADLLRLVTIELIAASNVDWYHDDRLKEIMLR